MFIFFVGLFNQIHMGGCYFCMMTGARSEFWNQAVDFEFVKIITQLFNLLCTR